MIELAAFFGNPGREYARNRHNAGWLLAQTLPFWPEFRWRRDFQGHYTTLEWMRLAAIASAASPVPGGAPVIGEDASAADHPSRIHFLLPETFMNNSGDPVYRAASFFKIEPAHILVVHDELELPLGTAALKFSGGLGGHNGLRSLKAVLGTADFWRLRIGIGRPSHDDIAGWVLSDFPSTDEPVLEPVLTACAAVLIQALIRGPGSLLPEWNKKKI